MRPALTFDALFGLDGGPGASAPSIERRVRRRDSEASDAVREVDLAISAAAITESPAVSGLDALFGEVARPEHGRAESGRPDAATRPRRVEASEPSEPNRSERARAARAAAPAPRPAAPVGRRRARAVRAIASMGLAAGLALATSVPALSLLTPEDVQALALSATSTKQGRQSLALDGDELATPTIDRDGYQHQSIEEYAAAAGIRPEATFTNNPLGTIQWPFKVGVHIGDRFGYRDCAGCSEDHHGQDFNPGYGAEIQAIADGVVSESTDSGGSLGVVTMIDHVIDGQVITSVYAHMQYGSRRFEIGDPVKVGDVVGNTGSTGMSTGPHLHFEIRIGGINGEWVDPLEWLYENTN
ncbi:M23 family metallopeptidase [Agromyces larvae]|uniref:M23 family metallopeptidase n=1 Tax=Agromyces larvae TaxID=2929802 RepID=A0ABY4BX70_9MICO|nr:M23 family metallopeptidase [Agromyces larvae]UOE43820.1 M23 family metallopeptidase [Agromyces larvae]